tara:strand:- start:9087 stop:9545 length:459 start_codon:yes stop_codon:yes gene_type:complete
MKRYLNRDFTIYKCLAKTQQDWGELFEPFLHPTFRKFSGLTEEELLYKYGIMNHDVTILHFTKETGVMVGHYGASHTFIIPNENTEFLKYFEDNAPMKYFEKKKQIRGLEWFANSRDDIKENFDEWVEIHKVDKTYREKFKGLYDSYKIDIN